jgi:hypothetical protein
VNRLSPILATGSTVATWLTQADEILSFVVTVLTLVWWVRLWLKNPNVKSPSDTMKKPTVQLLIVLLAAIAAVTGCASIKHRMVDEVTTYATNGTRVVTTKTTDSKASAFWDARQTIGQLKVANGKLHTLGLTDASQESTATNLVPMVEALAQGIASGLAKSLKP